MTAAREQPPPRVLTITHNKIQPYTGGGVVLGTLFSELPPQNLMMLHADDTEFEGASYDEHRLDERTLRPTVGSALRFAFTGGRAAFRDFGKVRRPDLVQLAVQSCRFTIPDSVDAKIRGFKPEVIYAWVADSVWARLLETCAARYGIPYVIHFMDNHMDLVGDTPLQAASHDEFRRNLRRVVGGAERVFTISDAMSTAYEARFRKPVESFHGVMDSKEWPWDEPGRQGEAFTLAFTGSVESGQLDGLRAVADAVDSVAAAGRRIRLVLYLTEFYERRVREALGERPTVEYIRHPDLAGLRPALQAADLLVLAYGFNESCIQYYRYSFATKTVPYMLSSRCILAYGPLSIEPIAYPHRGGWAHVVSEEGAPALATAIVRLMGDATHRRALARAAHEAGIAEHDLESNSRRFVRSLSGVAGRAKESARG